MIVKIKYDWFGDINILFVNFIKYLFVVNYLAHLNKYQTTI